MVMTRQLLLSASNINSILNVHCLLRSKLKVIKYNLLSFLSLCKTNVIDGGFEARAPEVWAFVQGHAQAH